MSKDNSKFSNFDELPNAAMVGIQVVAEIFDSGTSTIRLRVKQNRLPAPVKIGRSSRWNVGVLREFIAMRAVAKRYPIGASPETERLAALMAGCQATPSIPPFEFGPESESEVVENEQLEV